MASGRGRPGLLASNKVCTARKVWRVPGIPLEDGFLQLHGKTFQGTCGFLEGLDWIQLIKP